jgi:hypothetical protein
MTDLKPWRSTRPSPWPRRMAYIALIVLAALLLYVFSAHAAPPRPPDFSKPKIGPMAPPRTNHDMREGRISWCIRGAPAFALPPKCARRPHR